MYVCTFNGLEQRLIVGDLEKPSDREKFTSALPDQVGMVYSDPPWNPGNATYWRTHAKRGPCTDYDEFLDCWCAVVKECIGRGAAHIFCEQSHNEKHRELLFCAIYRAAWFLGLQEEWTVYYGSPGSASVKRPNTLLHFGDEPIKTDPSDMAGEPMTIRVCAGAGVPPGEWVVDPCIGKGMTSRMAHYFQWNCVGMELNQKRMDKTISWLSGRGYRISEVSR